MGFDNAELSQPAHLDLTEWQQLPPAVYVPIQQPGAENDVAVLELRENGSGQSFLPAYTTVEALGAALGPEQAWMQILPSRIPQLAEQTEFVSILVDAAMPRDPESVANDLLDDGRLYIPSRPFSEGEEEALLEMQPIVGGQLALPVFTSREALIDGCGPHQPWVSIPASRLEEARLQVGADVIYEDQALPNHVRHRRNEAASGRVPGHGTDDEGGDDGRRVWA